MARYLVDTNVLLRSAAPTSAHYASATEAIRRLRSRGERPLLAPQVIMEFWAVTTRPKEVNGYGWSASVAAANVAALLARFPLLPETPAVFDEWLRLVSHHGVIGKQAHDARLVAILNTHGVSHLLTFNVGDFQRYGIVVVSPEDV